MSDNKIRVYLLPGAATDWRMYTPQLREFPEIIIPAWLEPLSQKESLESYAKRWVATLDLTEPYIIGGTSLGGMIAQEMAQYCRPEAVILIATARSYRAIPLFLRATGKIIGTLPDFLVGIILKTLSVIVPRFLTKNPGERKIYADMLKEMKPHLASWQVKAAIKWQLSKKNTVPVFQVHGRDDMIISHKHANPSKSIKGGHLINVIHSVEVNKFIQNALSSIRKARETYEASKLKIPELLN